MQRSTSSIQPACLGVNTEWASSRREPLILLIDARAIAIWSLVRKSQVGSSKGAPGQQRHLGVAVDEDLLEVVLELVAGQGVLAPERRVPVLLGVLGEIEQARLVEVVAHEVGLGVDDELLGERARPLVRPPRASGPRPRSRRRAGRRPRSWPGRRPPCPALEARNRRRSIPCRGPRPSASSLMRASTRCCSRVCGSGMNSPLETIWVGTGEANAATSAGAVRVSSSSLR